MTLALRTQALLDLVEQERQRRCAALLAEARAQAQTLRAESRAQARARVREAFTEERERVQARLAAAQAELQTRRRLHAQRHLEALLALAWQRVPLVLVERWRDATSREHWVAATLASARQLLAAGPWQVEHAPGWPEDERARSAAAPLELRFIENPSIAAGLRITSDGNVVDATLDALLGDRDEIGGRLVAALDSAAQPVGSLPAQGVQNSLRVDPAQGPS